MSLNGLDAQNIGDALQATQADPGGWLFLRYVSRDEIELFKHGGGGVAQARAAVTEHGTGSPLFAVLHYRRRRIVVKYIPDGLSRLVTARAAVQFNLVTERFAPFDATFNASSPDDFSDGKLAASCSLHTASLSSASSLDPKNNLANISEAVEEAQTSQDGSRPHTPNQPISTEDSTPVGGSLAEGSITPGRGSNERSFASTRPSEDHSVNGTLKHEEVPTEEITSSNPEVASILAKLRAEKLAAARSESPASMSDLRSITSDERPRVSRILARLKAEREERAHTPESDSGMQEADEEIMTPMSNTSNLDASYGNVDTPMSAPPVKATGEAEVESIPPSRPESLHEVTAAVSGSTRPPRKHSGLSSHRKEGTKNVRKKTKSIEKLWTPEQLEQELANFNPNVGPRPLDQSEIKRPKTAESKRMRLPKGLRSFARKATQDSSKSKSNKNSSPATDISNTSRPTTSPSKVKSSASIDIHGLATPPIMDISYFDPRPRTASSKIEERNRSLSLDKPMPPLPDEALRSAPVSSEKQRLMKALQMRQTKELHRIQTEPPNLPARPPDIREAEMTRVFTADAPRSDSGVDVGSQARKGMPSLHMALHSNPVTMDTMNFASPVSTPDPGPTSAGAAEPETESDVFYDAATTPQLGANVIDWNPSVLDAIRFQMQQNSTDATQDDGSHKASPSAPLQQDPALKRKAAPAPLQLNGPTTAKLDRDTPKKPEPEPQALKVPQIANRDSILGDPFNFSIDPNEASFFLKDDSPPSRPRRSQPKPPLEPLDTRDLALSKQAGDAAAVQQATGGSTKSKRKTYKERASIAPSLFYGDDDSDSEHPLYHELKSATLEEAQRVQLMPTPTSASQSGPNSAVTWKPGLAGLRQAPVSTVVIGGGSTSNSPKAQRDNIAEPRPDSRTVRADSASIVRSRANSKAASPEAKTEVKKGSFEDTGVDAKLLDKPPTPKSKTGSVHKKSNDISKRIQALAEMSSRRDQNMIGSSAMSIISNDDRHTEVSSVRDLPESRHFGAGRNGSRRPSFTDENRPPSSTASHKGARSIRKGSHSQDNSSSYFSPIDSQNKQSSVSYTARIIRSNHSGIHEIKEDAPYSPVSPLLDFHETPVTVDYRYADLPRPSINSRRDDRPRSSRSSRPPSRESGISTFTRHSIEQGKRFMGRSHSARPTSNDEHSRSVHAHSRSNPSNVSNVSSPSPLPSATLYSNESSALHRVEESPASPETSAKKASRTGRLLKRMSALNAVAKKPLAELSLKFSGVAEADEPLSPRKKGPAPGPIAVGDLNVQFPDSLLWKRRWVEVDSRGNLVLSNTTPQLRATGKNVLKTYPLTTVKPPIVPTKDREELPYSIFIEINDGGTLQLACEDPIGQSQVLRRLFDSHKAWLDYTY